MNIHHTLEQYRGDCIETQEAPKVHQSNKSSGPGHVCPLNGQHPRNNQLIANDWQYEDFRLIRESNVENLDAVAQPIPEDAEGASTRVSEDEIAARKARDEE